MNSYVLMLQTDVDDRELTESTVSEMRFSVPLKFLASADELEEFFVSEGKPTVILISEAPRGRGIELVKQLKSEPAWSHIPIVVLGERLPGSYVKDFYRAGANTFITKPSSLELTKKKIEAFFRYWFEVAEV